jgi:cyclic beta-1,2-glucan synthetase
MKQLAVDLVILNERPVSYINDLQNRAGDAAAHEPGARAAGAHGARGAVFLLRSDLISVQTRALLSSVARVVLVGQRGSLAEQLERLRAPWLPPFDRARHPTPATRPWPTGGHCSLARSRVLQRPRRLRAGRPRIRDVAGPGQSTPAPWINVVANPRFGFQVAAEGSGYTWSLNSRDNQLTPGPTIRSAIGRARCCTCAMRKAVSSGAHGVADPRSRRGLYRPARPGLQPFRAQRARH